MSLSEGDVTRTATGGSYGMTVRAPTHHISLRAENPKLQRRLLRSAG